MGLTGYSDRSRVLTGQRCPRQRWYEYHAPTPQGRGIVPTRLNMDLLLGLTFHQGVEGLLLGQSEDEAVKTAVEDFMWPLLKSKGLVLGSSEDAYYVYHEQAALAEALIRGYARVCLPKILERFEVVEVERDDYATFTNGDFELRWGYRADALLMEKDSLDLYILSLKTTKEMDKRKGDDALRDMQGLSEVAAVDQRLKKWHNQLEYKVPTLDGEPAPQFDSRYADIPQWFVERFKAGAEPHVMGVKMEYALKGRRGEYPKGSGQWFYWNPLIRPWYTDGSYVPKRKGATAVPEGYAAAWEFQDDLGGNHTLGSGWRPVNIWEGMGVKAWIDRLATEEIQGREPGYFLERQFVLPMETFRNDDDIARWEKRMLYAEERMALGQGVADMKQGAGFEDALDEYFEPHSNSCTYPSQCSYIPICYGPKAYLHDPLASGLFEPRTPNHRAELVHLTGVKGN